MDALRIVKVHKPLGDTANSCRPSEILSTIAHILVSHAAELHTGKRSLCKHEASMFLQTAAVGIKSVTIPSGSSVLDWPCYVSCVTCARLAGESPEALKR
ncbi:hypothetical protein PAXRUDRAFT_826818 [Paxillus rubicundulus Ve08.2h10]|uniref:Uncharacterized protein n=1 Tax=Paxillus rubicundulus Ve08.2h10 TaxID=930991 RepID=A0A0D0DZ25_9AGAM|nr:hypothetical protein PAXRUDRAFT_826818 [Paxillus rubicundulus Ve08.2h10]